MRNNIGLDAKAQTNMATIFKQLLGSSFVIYTKVWSFHWNFVGAGFNDRHAYFGGVKDEFAGHIDMLAERVRQFGEIAPGSLAEMLANTKIPETTGSLVAEGNSFSVLTSDIEALIQAVRKAEYLAASNSDCVSSNLLQDFVTSLEKTLWFLHANQGHQ